MAVRNWKGPQLELALYTVSRFLDSTYYTRPLCPTLRFPAPSVVPLVSPDPNLHPLRHELLLCPRAHLHAPAGPSSRPRLAGPSYIPSEGRLPRHPLHFSSQRDTEREPVWPSGKAGKRKDLGSIQLRLSFLLLWFVDTVV